MKVPRFDFFFFTFFNDFFGNSIVEFDYMLPEEYSETTALLHVPLSFNLFRLSNLIYEH